MGLDIPPPSTESSSDGDGNPTDGEGGTTETAETTEEPVAPEGLGTSFCEFQVAVEFCRDSSNGECPSCEQLALQNNPVCKQNPVACMPSITDSQMAVYQAQCPSDPMYASSSYIQNQGTSAATTNTGNASSFGNAAPVQSLAQITADDQGNIDYSNAIAERGGVSTTFSARMPAGVGSAMGASLFSSTSTVYQSKCELGELNNCGPLAGL